ncbi:MAG TPA: hypothetical protein PLZ93_00520 [Nocardioides sp.]|uniref:hypothetical protein n=1 Tax=uncultured Nocardioides sp. TaxID=198441 RepID=UPI00260BDB88|nr:hypothetical protein [uncultured Nocardioides sp.]HRD60451.1 hypothetical protein [Nocardioides sp.]HRI94076.1 hypothetical protein [Nocardioides sp.]HRK44117.1 hypothetical protein [Nocardioides sp.]
MSTSNGLRALMEATAETDGCGLKDLTVLAAQNDPFRVDTPARHRDGEWLASTAADLGLGDRTIHLRGLHYMVLGRPKPDGTAYTNTDADWLWLSGDAAKAARWLGYLPWEQVVDQRNAAPLLRERPADDELELKPYISVGMNVEIPDVADLAPEVLLLGRARQAYSLALVGEKSSLEPVLAPLARRYDADLYLPTGEPSDTMLHTMASRGARDGRPLVVLYFSDCDPAGWQMPISVGRKLQAFRATLFPELEVQVRRVALMPDQVREHALPSTPLKETERRADKWSTAMGVAQTEIDALAALNPELLTQIAIAEIEQFYDLGLEARMIEVKREWRERAQVALDTAMDPALLGRLQAEAGEKLATLRTELDAINDRLRIDAGDLDLPAAPDAPNPVIGDVYPKALLDSTWSFSTQCRELIASKEYRSGWSA